MVLLNLTNKRKVKREGYKMAKYSIGLDYGTLSVRALMVDIHTGEEVATSVYEYPHGVMETRIPCGKKLPSGWALQDPQDYMD